MNFLEALQDAAHGAVRIIDRPHRALHRRERVLGESDGLGRMAFPEELLDPVDGVIDSPSVAARAAVLDEVADIHRAVDRATVRGEIEPSWSLPRRLHQQLLAQAVIVLRLRHDRSTSASPSSPAR